MSSLFDNNDQALNDRIRAVVNGILADPTSYPDELKSWVPKWIEVNPPATQLQDIQNLYTMASTVSGLGAKVNGRVGMIRSGSSPYEYLHVTYDSTLGKWISEAQIASQFTFPISVGVTTWSGVGDGSFAMTNLIIANAKNLYDAGLSPQISWSATLNASSNGIVVEARPTIYEFDSGTIPSSGTLLAHTTGMSYTRAGGVSSSAIQSWQDVSWDATPSKTSWYFQWELKTSSGTMYVNGPYTSFRVRWVG